MYCTLVSDNSRWSAPGEHFIDVEPWDHLAGCFEEATEDHGVVDEEIGVVQEQIGTSNLMWARSALGLHLPVCSSVSWSGEVPVTLPYLIHTLITGTNKSEWYTFACFFPNFKSLLMMVGTSHGIS